MPAWRMQESGKAMDRFDVSWSPRTRSIAIRMAKFWPDWLVPRFEEALLGSIRNAAGGSFDCVADLSELLPQSAQMVALQTGVIARLRLAGMRHLVIVGAAPLLTMQVKRAAAPLEPHFVKTSAEAREWLDGQPLP